MQLTELKDLISKLSPGSGSTWRRPEHLPHYLLQGWDKSAHSGRRGINLVFRSRSKAFDTLREMGVKSADFVHKSAFDEMVGVGDGTPTEHGETVTLQGTGEC